MYVVTFALRDESREFRKLLTNLQRRDTNRCTVEVGSLHGVDVAIGHIGVGRAAAARGIAAILLETKPKVLICAGYGGALDPTLRIGDLVLDLQHAEGSPDLQTCLRIGSITTAEAAVETIAAKRALFSSTGASVVDMETETVAAACLKAGVPMLAIRVVSDEAGQPLPVPMQHWFDLECQRPRPLALVRYLILHPSAILPFAQFVSGLSGARVHLAEAISGLIAELAAPPPR